MPLAFIYFITGILSGGAVAWAIAIIRTRSTGNILKADFEAVTAALHAANLTAGIEQEKVLGLTAALAISQQEQKVRDEELRRNTSMLATLTNENEHLQQQWQETKAVGIKAVGLAEEKQALAHELEKQHSATCAQLNVTHDTIDRLNKEQEELRLSLANKTDAYNEANKKSVQLEALYDALEQKIIAHKEAAALASSDFSEVKASLAAKTEEVNSVYKKVADLTARNEALAEKLALQKEEIVAIQSTSHLQFEKIANQILEDKSNKFTEVNKINIEALLKPLGENIQSFKTKVEETYDKEARQRFSLEQKVKELIEQTNIVSAEANNLATALKGQSKKQGNWGEVILESILQKSGLVKDREYFIQKNIKDDEGKNLRPDVLVHLPDNRIIIIDSKVSLVAYDRFSSADRSDEQTIHLKEHLRSVYTHIDDLHSKSYDNLEAALDFTMMFIPIEPAYMAAIQGDQELWAYAYSKRILLISPTNLIACLKLIGDLWKREMQSKNAMEIVRRGDLLYEKFVGFVDTIEDVGKHINKTQLAYNNAVSQLKTGSGNLIGHALKLKNLGLKSNKEVSAAMQPSDVDDEGTA